MNAQRMCPDFPSTPATPEERSIGAFHTTRWSQVFQARQAGDAGLDALRDLPALGKLTDKAFPDAEKALKDSTPIFSFVRPYVPDLVSWVKSFGGAAAPGAAAELRLQQRVLR